MRLTDLTAGGVEVGGTKTELLAKIAGLIGLSFEQFSRSVLLAQGDFATFLKARQSEKAEILEKLTGTEIYSRISASIYEHWRQAKTGYEQLKAKMQDVVLLSGEELEKLMEEDRTLDDVIRREQTERDRQKARLQWLSRSGCSPCCVRRWNNGRRQMKRMKRLLRVSGFRRSGSRHRASVNLMCRSNVAGN